MEDTKKPLLWMIAFGIVRAALVFVGAKLQSHGLIDPDTHKRLISEGASQFVGWLLVAVPVIWTVVQKWQVFGWVKSAIKGSSQATPIEALESAPGPSVPV